MNERKLARIIRLLRENGVAHLKTLEFEIRLSDGHGPKAFVPPAQERAKAPPHEAAAPPVENAIPHHVNEVANLLKLSDEDLVDKIFPDYTQVQPHTEGGE